MPTLYDDPTLLYDAVILYDDAGVTDVPGRFQVSINGRSFLLADWGEYRLRRRSVPALKPQQDTGEKVGERSLSAEGAWLRSIEDWSHGAGQTYYDRENSDAARFRDSKGVDPWTRWQISLLPDTANKRSSAATNLALLSVGAYLYVADGNEVYHTADIAAVTPVWTSAVIHVAEGAQAVKSLATDGYYLYAALGSNGIHRSVRGAGASSHFSDLSATLVGYVKGRLMAANGNAIYNVIAAGAAPAALFTHPNTDFTWVGFADGPGHIYAAGYSGDRSLVYRTAVVADGTALAIPVVAGELPDGEVVRSIQGYLGRLLIGTDKGWRLVDLDANGNFSRSSDIIPTTSAVYAFEPQDRFVWYGLTNYDAASTGLGRADLSVFTSGTNPAYASDLMATAQGAVLSIATFGNLRVFAVSGSGVWAEVAEKVTTATLRSGLISMGISDPKVLTAIDVRHRSPAPGTHATAVSADESSSWSPAGSHGEGDTTHARFSIFETRGEVFELMETLTRSLATPTTGPTVIRTTAFAYPAPRRATDRFIVPLALYENQVAAGADVTSDPGDELDRLVALKNNGTIVDFTAGTRTWRVQVDDYQFIGEKLTDDRSWWNGVVVVELKEVA